MWSKRYTFAQGRGPCIWVRPSTVYWIVVTNEYVQKLLAADKGGNLCSVTYKRQLVAETNLHRVGEDSKGNTYNIDRGSHTLV